jgi:hypothetical protein
MSARVIRVDYIGRHRFNTRFWTTRERKPEMEVVEMTVPPIIEAAEFEAVQVLLKTRSPATPGAAIACVRRPRRHGAASVMTH